MHKDSKYINQELIKNSIEKIIPDLRSLFEINRGRLDVRVFWAKG